MNKTTAPIPEGYMRNSLGHLVPEENVSDVDKLRDELVRQIIGRLHDVRKVVADFKTAAFADVCAFIDLCADKYEVKLGGRKGNVTLVSYDGRYKILLAVDESITFTEQMSLARKLIFECVERWSAGADPALVTLIHTAFETDKQGHLSTSRILALRGLRIEDETWKRAMELIGESIQVLATVHYLRFYERDEDGPGKYLQLAIDGSRL